MNLVTAQYQVREKECRILSALVNSKIELLETFRCAKGSVCVFFTFSNCKCNV